MLKPRMRLLVCLFLGVFLIFAGCGNGGGNYSNSTLDGPWLLLSPAADVHLEADGMGNITDHGFMNSGTPPGFYSVDPDGSFEITINTSTPIVLIGQFISDTAATLDGGGPDPLLFKVLDRSLCQGNWTGALDRTSPPETKNVSFTVDSSGLVTSLTGLTGFVDGRMYAVGTNFVGFWVTSEVDAWNQVRPFGTLVVNTASGEFDLDSGVHPEGTCSFTR